ncbi:MAG: hypothetical protein ACE5EB_04220 [Thermodesulfobacteriota bacterium]
MVFLGESSVVAPFIYTLF